MLDHNVLEPYKFINVSIYMFLLITFYKNSFMKLLIDQLKLCLRHAV